LSEVKAPGGRSLSKSIVVGLLLAAVFLASLLVYKEFFILFLVTATAIGAWELSTALRIKGWYVPRVPAVVGSVIIMPATYYGGPVVQWLVSLGNRGSTNCLANRSPALGTPKGQLPNFS
jgi:phosphatidate cytidylyltransferase